jgi:predicted RND superfamily exporter protein/outer membrane lipoprotein-sorting protein
VSSYLTLLLRYRFLVLAATLLVTATLGTQLQKLQIVIDPNRTLPQDHPYVAGTRHVEDIFGNRYVVVIGITPYRGDIFQPDVLSLIDRLTRRFLVTPQVIKANLLSLAAPLAKNIQDSPQGMQVRQFMKTVPQTPEALQRLRDHVHNNPVYSDLIVSHDSKTAAIIVEFNSTKWNQIVETVQQIIDTEHDPGLADISIGGLPIYLAAIERYSQRMAWLFPLCLLVIGLIHFEAFRTIQALALPLVTALLAVIWALGIMGLARVPLDSFNVTTPILILAVAAGHAVQILKRYYEEFHKAHVLEAIPARQANRLAVIRSLSTIGPVMLTAGAIASLGFASLIVFQIVAIRTFGIFTALGILSAMILEFTFIPALRAVLPPPGARESRREQQPTIVDRFTDRLARIALGMSRNQLLLIIAGITILAVWGGFNLRVDNTEKGYFFPSLEFQRQDRLLNQQLAGTNTLYVLFQGKDADSMKEPAALKQIWSVEQFLQTQPFVGKTVSFVDFLIRMNQSMHDNDPAYATIPKSRELISQYLLLYSLSGDPGDFDRFIDNDYRTANLWVLLKSDSSAAFTLLTTQLRQFLQQNHMTDVSVEIGGSVAGSTALTDVMVHQKLLNIAQIIAVIFLVSSVVFRSFLGGLLVLLPIALAVGTNFGLMGLFGIRLNTATAVITAMAAGIGADYAVYLIFRIKEEISREADEMLALRTALMTAGKAICFVASAIACGYAMFIMSWGFYVHIWFGVLIPTAMLVSSMAAMLLIPNLLMMLRPSLIFAKPATQSLAKATLALAAICMFMWVPSDGQAEELTGRDIMLRNYNTNKPAHIRTENTMTLINGKGQERIRKVRSAQRLEPNGVDSKVLITFVFPPDIARTGFLQWQHHDRDDDMWLYLPALKKVRRLAPADKNESFVGTDFSNGDILTPVVDNYTRKLLRREVLDGEECYVVESTPSTGAVLTDYGYSKTFAWIRVRNFVEKKVDYFDTTGLLFKTQMIDDAVEIDQRRHVWWPRKREMLNHQTGHKTTVTVTSIDTNTSLPDETFAARTLERG